MIGPTSRGGSRSDIKKIHVAATTTPSATPDRSQYVPRRRATTRSSRPTMGRNFMARSERRSPNRLVGVQALACSGNKPKDELQLRADSEIGAPVDGSS